MRLVTLKVGGIYFSLLTLSRHIVCDLAMDLSRFNIKRDVIINHTNVPLFPISQNRFITVLAEFKSEITLIEIVH